MRVSILSRLFLLAVLVAASQSCGATTPSSDVSTPTAADAPTPASPLATPADDVSAVSVLPTPEPDLSAEEVGSGTLVRGTLILFDPVNMAPEDDGIYLAPIEPSGDEGVSFTAPVIDETAIRGEVDETTGAFRILAVPVGFYALVARTDSGQQLSIRGFETHTATFVKITEDLVGQSIDLGEQRIP